MEHCVRPGRVKPWMRGCEVTLGCFNCKVEGWGAFPKVRVKTGVSGGDRISLESWSRINGVPARDERSFKQPLPSPAIIPSEDSCTC